MSMPMSMPLISRSFGARRVHFGSGKLKVRCRQISDFRMFVDNIHVLAYGGGGKCNKGEEGLFGRKPS